MKIWTDLAQVPGNQRSVVTIGNFDGMHRGHTRVIETCVQRAQKHGADSVALTFDPHPRAVHAPGNPTPLIMSLQTRLDAMANTGLDAVFVATYDPSLYSLTAEEFVVEYLVERLGAVEVVVGEDFHFGRGNEGDVETLLNLGKRYNFAVAMVTDISAPSGRRWSSSWVRQLLDEGKVDEVAEVLGSPYRLVGTVQHGEKRGRELGFPTANLYAGEGVLSPADGVYAGWLVRDVPGHTQAQEFLPAAISVGTNPQFDGTQRTVEAHVLGRDDLDLYDQQVAVVFTKFLRPMMKFESVDQLLAQMDEDIRMVASSLGVRPSTRTTGN
ncbi:MAG: bifunctional riboflavin kinase/FAD synthetase [Scrofimicrobium sp.]